MDFIFEFIFDLILEGSVEVAKERKISPWIRIPCLIFVLLFSIFIIGGLAFVGIYMLIKPDDQTSFYMGIVCLILDLIMIIGFIREYKKEKQKRIK